MDLYSNYEHVYRIVVCRQCSAGIWSYTVTARFRSDAYEFTLPQVRRLV